MKKSDMTQEEVRAWIKARCHEDAGCLIWEGPTSHSGVPVMDSQTKPSVRRALYESSRGSVSKDLVFPNTCGNRLCVCHTKPVTRSEARRLAAEMGAYKGRARVVKTTLKLRAASKYGEDTVRLIREARTAKEAHEITGVSLPYVYQIRDGVRRAPLVTPFAGLGAR